MEHKLTITLSDELYQRLAQAARTLGQTPEELAAQWLIQTTVQPYRNFNEHEAQEAQEG